MGLAGPPLHLLCPSLYHLPEALRSAHNLASQRQAPGALPERADENASRNGTPAGHIVGKWKRGTSQKERQSHGWKSGGKVREPESRRGQQGCEAGGRAVPLYGPQVPEAALATQRPLAQLWEEHVQPPGPARQAPPPALPDPNPQG